MSPELALFIVIVVGVLLNLYTHRTSHKQYPEAKIVIPGANFYGQESKGMMKSHRVMRISGNGTLVLTDKEIYFQQWLPRGEFRIALSAVQAVEIPSSFLGKPNFRPLLKLVFQNDAGQTDSMFWLVPDVAAAQQAVEAARR